MRDLFCKYGHYGDYKKTHICQLSFLNAFNPYPISRPIVVVSMVKVMATAEVFEVHR